MLFAITHKLPDIVFFQLLSLLIHYMHPQLIDNCYFFESKQLLHQIAAVEDKQYLIYSVSTIIPLCQFLAEIEDTEYAQTHLPTQNSENYISNIVQLLAQFQHRFVIIHPFVDYNGRMGRLLTNYILMRLRLPIIEIKVENETDRKAYIAALQKADIGDYTSIENIIAEALVESLQETER